MGKKSISAGSETSDIVAILIVTDMSHSPRRKYESAETLLRPTSE
jgi:hypothetical protein